MMGKTLNPVMAEKDGYGLIDECENIFGVNQIKLDTDHDNLTNYQEYSYNMPSSYSE